MRNEGGLDDLSHSDGSWSALDHPLPAEALPDQEMAPPARHVHDVIVFPQDHELLSLESPSRSGDDSFSYGLVGHVIEGGTDSGQGGLGDDSRLRYLVDYDMLHENQTENLSIEQEQDDDMVGAPEGGVVTPSEGTTDSPDDDKMDHDDNSNRESRTLVEIHHSARILLQESTNANTENTQLRAGQDPSHDDPLPADVQDREVRGYDVLLQYSGRDARMISQKLWKDIRGERRTIDDTEAERLKLDYKDYLLQFGIMSNVDRDPLFLVPGGDESHDTFVWERHTRREGLTRTFFRLATNSDIITTVGAHRRNSKKRKVGEDKSKAATVSAELVSISQDPRRLVNKLLHARQELRQILQTVSASQDHSRRLVNELLRARQELRQTLSPGCEDHDFTKKVNQINEVSELFDALEHLSRHPLKNGYELSYNLEKILEYHAVKMVDDLMAEVRKKTDQSNTSAVVGQPAHDPSGGHGNGHDNSGWDPSGGGGRSGDYGAQSESNNPHGSSPSTHVFSHLSGSSGQYGTNRREEIQKRNSEDDESECLSDSENESISDDEYVTSSDEESDDDDDQLGGAGCNQSDDKFYSKLECVLMEQQIEVKKEILHASDRDLEDSIDGCPKKSSKHHVCVTSIDEGQADHISTMYHDLKPPKIASDRISGGAYFERKYTDAREDDVLLSYCGTDAPLNCPQVLPKVKGFHREVLGQQAVTLLDSLGGSSGSDPHSPKPSAQRFLSVVTSLGNHGTPRREGTTELQHNIISTEFSEDDELECLSTSQDELRSYNGDCVTSNSDEPDEDDHEVGATYNQSKDVPCTKLGSAFMNLQLEVEKDFRVSDCDVDSIFNLAKRYFVGKRVKKDVMKAVKLYKRAADQGHLESIYLLGCCYFFGTGVDKNEKRAVELHQRAANLGHLPSVFNLGMCYYTGTGVNKDVSKAVKLYQQAADQGHLPSLYNLGMCYHIGTGVDKDVTMAAKLYQRAVAQRHSGSMYRLGLCYEHGTGVDKNERRAACLYHEAANKGHGLSFVKLGFCFLDGSGVKKSVEKARAIFKQGFENGVLQSLFAYSLTFVDNPSMVCGDQLYQLIRTQAVDFSLSLSQSYLVHENQQSLREQATAENKSFLDSVNTSTAFYILAELLASTLDPDNLRRARNLLDQVSAHGGESGYTLWKWVSVFVKDQCEEDELWSNVKLPSDRVYIAPRDIRPLALIGEGHFGKVYLSWLPRENDFVATKYIGIDLADKDELLARNLLREQLTCRVLTSKRIQNTVKYLGYTDLVDQGKRGLVFELCADVSAVQDLLTSMREEMQLSPPYSVVDLERLPDWTKKVPTSMRSSVVFVSKRHWGMSHIVRMLRETAEALFEVHKLGFIHRDIAPRNILCDSNGSIRLADFGLAKYVGSNSSDDAIFNKYKKECFTPGHQYALAWWAPECFGCEEEAEPGVFSWNSDVYALGITMWQCFARDEPFSYILKQEACREKAVARIQSLILEGKRPSVNKATVLDEETPGALTEILVSCWNADPEKRPKLTCIIDSLQQTEKDLTYGSSSTKTTKAFQDTPQQRWHDVSSMYQYLKPPNVVSDRIVGGTYLEMKYKNELQSFRHERMPSSGIPPALTATLNLFPYDVFLIHAAEQKESADTMKNLLEEGNLSCFLDQDMAHGTDPTETMRAALRTCRYAVVILSRRSLDKKHPCMELKYAFDRLMWIRQNCIPWKSLRVISYDLSVDEYETLRTESPHSPPSLHKHVEVKQRPGQQIKSWWQECLELKVSLIEEDKKESAVPKWLEFLKQIHESDPAGFPSASALYP